METIASAKNKALTELIFSRHETFHPRYGWLKKGFDKAVEKPDLFSSDEAPTILGVGKNMVKAIKYWCIAFKILKEVKKQGQGRSIEPTSFGKDLLSDEGWDPYLEDPASLWLLHWSLLKPPCHATAWYYLFNVFNKSTFIINEVRDNLIEFKDSSFLNNRILESSVVKDISCILRMYSDHRDNKLVNEDSIDSPFTELGLIHNYGDSRNYIFNTEPKNNLPPHIIVSACLDYVDIVQESAKTMSIARLAYEAGSPGLCFKLSEGALADALENIAKQYDEISLSDTAGSIQFSFEGEAQSISIRLLKDYFRRGNN